MNPDKNLANFDDALLTPRYLANPYPYYEALRRSEPVYFSARLNGWVLTRYDDVHAALRDSRLISGQRVQSYAAGLPSDSKKRLQPLYYQIGKWFNNMDPPDHTRLRRLLTAAFTPRVVEELRPRIKVVVNELLDKMDINNTSDFIAKFAYPLPAIVIAEMLGVPAEDHDKFMAWSDPLTAYAGTGKPQLGIAKKASDGAFQLTAYFKKIVDERRREPRADLISALVEVEEEGDRLTEHELLSMCGFVIVAGHETTMMLLCNGLLALLQNREQFEELKKDAQLTRSAVEECLRFDSSIQHQTRVAAEDFELGGREIKTGQRVLPFLGAANRDPAQFLLPNNFEIARSPNKHLAFGYGRRICLGAPLARLEAFIAFRAIADRYPNIQMAVDGDTLEWRHHTSNRNVIKLPVILQP